MGLLGPTDPLIHRPRNTTKRNKNGPNPYSIRDPFRNHNFSHTAFVGGDERKEEEEAFFRRVRRCRALPTTTRKTRSQPNREHTSTLRLRGRFVRLFFRFFSFLGFWSFVGSCYFGAVDPRFLSLVSYC